MDSQELDTMPVMSSQPTNSRRQSRDEEPPVPRRRRRIPSNRSLVIVFEVEPAFNGLPEGVFAGQFHNEDTEVHAWSEVEGVGHYRWLQGPMNHLPREQQLEFIADVMRHFYDGIDRQQNCFSETSKLEGEVMSRTYIRNF
ncbi:hypothetical protein M758_7G017200 [Ceratodon purpureus]|nr:hypothetical protein M758_7G017200 [Ceratodon purpureus]